MSINEFIDRVAKAHHEQPESRCPSCDGCLSCNAGVTDSEPPAPFDVSLCGHCGAILQFREDLTLDFCPASELEQMKAERPDNTETLLELQAKVRGFAAGRQRRKAELS